MRQKYDGVISMIAHAKSLLKNIKESSGLTSTIAHAKSLLQSYIPCFLVVERESRYARTKLIDCYFSNPTI